MLGGALDSSQPMMLLDHGTRVVLLGSATNVKGNRYDVLYTLFPSARGTQSPRSVSLLWIWIRAHNLLASSFPASGQGRVRVSVR